MENSKAYLNFKKQINKVGVSRKDGYNPRLIEEIYEWERNEVEEIIWKCFCEKNDIDMSIFMPKLRNFSGIKKLEEKLSVSNIPSEQSAIISMVLFELDEDDRYLEIMKKNIKLEPDNIANVSRLSYCKPCKKIYDTLVDIYINSDNDVMRDTAVTGILYNKGIITNPHDFMEVIKNMELIRKFDSDNVLKRTDIIEKFENNQL